MAGAVPLYLAGGGTLDLTCPDPAAVDFGAVFVGLARIPRFLGATSRPVSVLEHSLAVAAMCPPGDRLAGLLHDAHEAFLGDVPRPVAAALDAIRPGFSRDLDSLRARLDGAVSRAAVALSGPGERAERHADDLARRMAGPVVAAADEGALTLEIGRFVTGRLAFRPFAPCPGLYEPEMPAPDQLIAGALRLLEHLVAQDYGRRRVVEGEP